MSDIVNEWLSVEAAAIRLGISGRSIARRIQNGQLESRVDDNGRRSVLICQPAPTQTTASVVNANPSASGSQTENAIESSQAKELAQQAMTLVIRSHEETTLAARADVISAKRSMRRAWAAAAILLIGASVTVGIVTHNLTAASAIVREAQDRVDQAQRQAIALTVERDQLRQQLVEAKVQGAEAQGRLSAVTASLVIKPPTTAPASAAQRFASALFGE